MEYVCEMHGTFVRNTNDSPSSFMIESNIRGQAPWRLSVTGTPGRGGSIRPRWQGIAQLP